MKLNKLALLALCATVLGSFALVGCTPAEEGAEKVGEEAGQVMEETSEKVGEMGEEAGEKVGEMGEKAEETVSEAGAAAEAKVDEMAGGHTHADGTEHKEGESH